MSSLYLFFFRLRNEINFRDDDQINFRSLKCLKPNKRIETIYRELRGPGSPKDE